MRQITLQKFRCLAFYWAAVCLTAAVNAAAMPGDVELLVTVEFEKTVAATPVTLRGEETVADLLCRSTNCSSSYGGNFITAINGIPQDLSANDKHWFYYVNGRLAPVGARGFELQGGEHVWWDFHRSKDAISVSAVVGAFPRPFTTLPATPTRIVADGRYLDEAKRLQSRLQAADLRASADPGKSAATVPPHTAGAAISVEEFNPALEVDDSHLYIFIGPWASLKTHPWLEGLELNAFKTGFSVDFSEPGVLKPRNWRGEAGAALADAGVILAVGSAAPAPARWIVSGTGEQATRAALQLLIDSPESLKNRSAVVTHGGKVINVPTASAN